MRNCILLLFITQCFFILFNPKFPTLSTMRFSFAFLWFQFVWYVSTHSTFPFKNTSVHLNILVWFQLHKNYFSSFWKCFYDSVFFTFWSNLLIDLFLCCLLPHLPLFASLPILSPVNTSPPEPHPYPNSTTHVRNLVTICPPFLHGHVVMHKPIKYICMHKLNYLDFPLFFKNVITLCIILCISRSNYKACINFL